jgi:hypothetical protein
MFFVTCGIVAAAVGAIQAIDSQNQAGRQARRDDDKFAKNLSSGTGREPVTQRPEFLDVKIEVLDISVLMTGREAMWWLAEGWPNRSKEDVSRKVRHIIMDQPRRLGLVRDGYAQVG